MRIIGNRGNTARKVQAVASGALASGDTVIVNADGTVSAVAGTSVSSNVGTSSQYNSSVSGDNQVAFDSSANKFVVAYRDGSNSNRGTAVVGTVSGTNISFGTPVVFDTSYIDQITISFNSSVNKMLIAYRDGSTSRAIAGTVSGTNISFGSPSNFANNCISMSQAYDSNSNRSVIAYRDATNSSYGRAVTAAINASTSAVTFGTPVVFESATTQHTSAAFDSVNNKIVIAYQDNGNGSKGTSVVGTVSGTSISFGSPVIFYNGSMVRTGCTFDSAAEKVVIMFDAVADAGMRAIVGTVSGTSISFGTNVLADARNANTFISGTFDSTAGKVTFAYTDTGNANHGTLISGTVSGTSITFDTPVVFDGAGEKSTNFGTAFDSNANQVIIAYYENYSNLKGLAVLFRNAYSSTNITAKNYIGIASNGYADAQAATINVKGFIDDNQSSLTAGQSYYVQTDGTLGTTAGDPSVFAGTAVSANKLIVKG